MDSEYGAQGAVAAGMSAVIVPDLKQPGPETAGLCLAVLESLEQVPAFYDEWFQHHLTMPDNQANLFASPTIEAKP